MEQRKLQQMVADLEKKRDRLKEVIKQKREKLVKQKEREARTVNLAKCLKICEWINSTVFSNEEINITADGLGQCSADVQTGCVKYHISFTKKDLEDNEMVVTSLKAKYYNPFQEAELKSWKNKMVRENNIPRLISGTVGYKDLFIHREEVVNMLSERDASHFTVEKLLEDGEYNITANVKAALTSTPYFSCKWKIVWNEASHSMRPSLTFLVENTSSFFKENEYLLKKIIMPNTTQEEITELWKILIKNVMTENELIEMQ